MFSYASEPVVSRYTTWSTHRSLSDAERFIRMVRAYDGEFCWAIRLARGGDARGAIEFGFDDPSRGTVHFVLAAELWNRGIMTEAVTSVLGWAFGSFDRLEKVVTGAMAENVASRRVLEKCGFRLDGLVEEGWDKFDHRVEMASYTLTRETWTVEVNQ